jgi:hypothetical protein
MRSPNPAAILLGAFILGVTLELLRRRTLREKYATLWLAVSVAIVLLAVFPGVLGWTSRALGFQVPANLLFFVGGIVLTIISMQLSLESGRMEEESRRLAEEVALLRLQVSQLQVSQLQVSQLQVSQLQVSQPGQDQPPDGV